MRQIKQERTDADEGIVRLLGHVFRPLDKQDYLGFAGAADDAVICYGSDDTVLIATPLGGGDTEADDLWTVEEYGETSGGAQFCRRWTMTLVSG